MAPRVAARVVGWAVAFLLAGVLPIASPGAEQSPAENSPPNVVFILADDLGWQDLGCYGNDVVETPQIDRLAQSGMRFTQAYGYPTCSPSRVALMTGSYPSRFGMALHINPQRRGWERLSPPYSPSALNPAAVSIADVLATRGYISTLIGKWHLGYGERPFDLKNVVMPPGMGEKTARVSFGFVPPPSSDAPPIGADYEPRLQKFARENPGKGLGPQTLQAVRFLERNRERPFFCFLSYHAVHMPAAVRQELAIKYRSRVVARNGIQNPLYLAMVEAMDESVGLVLAALDELHLSGNTVVIFASDNGGSVLSHFYGSGPVVSVNYPLRGGKSTVWEGGIRVPYIVRWPGVVKPGTQSDEVTLCTDLLPTLAQIAGAKLPSDYSNDGISLVPVFRDPEMKLPDRALYWHQPAYNNMQASPASAVREGDWKLIQFLQDGHVGLYNLASDVGERHNLAAEKPAIAAALLAKLEQWRERVHAEMPSLNPNYDPTRAHVWTMRPKQPWEPARLEADPSVPSDDQKSE